MRFSAFAATLAALLITGAGCAGKSSNDQNSASSGDATATSAASPADQGASSPAPAISSTASVEASSGSSDTADVPTYPGATVAVAGSSTMAGDGQRATGKVLSTGDSFDDVYHWYQKNMPAGSESVHVTAPVETASFIEKGSGKDQTTVTISTNAGKTVITIARVSQ